MKFNVLPGKENEDFNENYKVSDIKSIIKRTDSKYLIFFKDGVSTVTKKEKLEKYFNIAR